MGTIVIALFARKGFNWSETYKPSDANPYGTQVLQNLLKAIYPDSMFITIDDSLHNQLPTDPSPSVDTYIFIGTDYFADSSDTQQLLKFVEAGNIAFIITSNPYHSLVDSLLVSSHSSIDNAIKEDSTSYDFDEIETSWEPESDETYPQKYDLLSGTIIDTSIHLSLTHFNQQHPYAIIDYRYRNVSHPNTWTYFQSDIITRSGDNIEYLGNFDETFANYLRFSHGKGAIYLHTTPIVFSNYYLIADSTMEYCRDALSYLGNGKMYWDDENRDYKFNHHYTPNALNKPNEGPLEFILSEPSLRAAWYLLLIGTILYLLFGSKRQQRVIPIKPNMDNTSIEYAQVISQLFMKQKDHQKLIRMKMDLFKSYVRERFRILISTNPSDQDVAQYVEEIAQKSGIPNEKVVDIFFNYQQLSKQKQVETSEMLQFHKKLEYFYTHCK